MVKGNIDEIVKRTNDVSLQHVESYAANLGLARIL
jgi:hypothetical protein